MFLGLLKECGGTYLKINWYFFSAFQVPPMPQRRSRPWHRPYIWFSEHKYLHMATPPNFTDLIRQQRLATNSRLSFNSIVNSGSPTSQNVALVPQINYDYLYVSGLTSTNGDFNGLYTRGFVTVNFGIDVYTVTYYNKVLIFDDISTSVNIADNGIIIGSPTPTWVYVISNDNIGDEFLSTSTAASGAPLPEGNANWSVFSNFGIGGRINVSYSRK